MSPAVGPLDCAAADPAVSADAPTAAALARPACLRNERLATTRCHSACSSCSCAGVCEGAPGRTSSTVILCPSFVKTTIGCHSLVPNAHVTQCLASQAAGAQAFSSR